MKRCLLDILRAGAPILIALASALILTACSEDAPISPIGGAGSSSSSSGAGGADGAMGPLSCASLVPAGELTELSPVPSSLSMALTLVPLDPGLTAIVRAIAIPGVGPVNTVTSNVAWTGAWPPEPSAPIELADRPGYVVGRAPTAVNSVALLGPPHVGASGVAFGVADALSGGWTELVAADPKAIRPTFIAANEAGGYFLGMSASAGIPGNNVAVPHIGWVETKGGTSYVGPTPLGCPIDPVSAAAVATSAGWLFARSVFDQDCSGSNPSVSISNYNEMVAKPAADVPSDPWPAVELLPRAGGAWLSIGDLGLTVARLDPLGGVELGPVVIALGVRGVIAEAYDVGLAFAVEHAEDADLTLGVTNDDLTRVAGAELALPSRASSFQMAFDPKTRQLLVAVVLSDESSGPPSSNVHVARFACQ